MQSIPVQSWTFEHESVVRIGRSTDNHVILYSAVVSRHHVELRQAGSDWEIVNLGANGTYLDGKRITQVPVADGVIIRLARSGPNVQIHLGAQNPDVSQLVGEKTIGQSAKPPSSMMPTAQTNIPTTDASATPFKLPAVVDLEDAGESTAGDRPQTALSNPSISPTDFNLVNPGSAQNNKFALSPCCHQYLNSEQLFCLTCGKPLKSIGSVETYQIVKILEEDEFSRTQLAWRDGQTLVLKTLLPLWMEHPEAAELFAQEARQLLQINHPALPRYVDLVTWLGQPYLVMEPVYGRSLHQMIATAGVASQEQAIAWVQQICDALDYLHHQTPPILHQSLRPESLIYRATSPTLVLTGLTPGRTIVPLHAPAEYAAPEQQQGQASIASDLYAVGPILVYLLTGKPPTAFYAQREQGFRFYAEYVPNLTSDLIAIIRKLTNPLPDDRFGSAKELAAALRHL